MSGLLELAERVERASGEYDPALCSDIHDVLAEPKCVQPPNYCASLDAAMTLVPEGFAFGCGHGTNDSEIEGWAWCGPDDGPYVFTFTPALALCAAALRARAA